MLSFLPHTLSSLYALDSTSAWSHLSSPVLSPPLLSLLFCFKLFITKFLLSLASISRFLSLPHCFSFTPLHFLLTISLSYAVFFLFPIFVPPILHLCLPPSCPFCTLSSITPLKFDSTLAHFYSLSLLRTCFSACLFSSFLLLIYHLYISLSLTHAHKF